MLFLLLAPLADDFIAFNLFRYITFRTGGAVMTALLIGFVVGPRLIAWLKRKQGEGQPIRADGPETPLKKKGTPTMGGLMILIAVVVSLGSHWRTWVIASTFRACSSQRLRPEAPSQPQLTL